MDENFFGYEYSTLEIPDEFLSELHQLGLEKLSILNGTCRVAYYENSFVSFELYRVYYFEAIGSGHITIEKRNISTEYIFEESPISIVALYKKSLLRAYTVRVDSIGRLILVINPVLIDIDYSRKLEYMLLATLRRSEAKILSRITIVLALLDTIEKVVSKKRNHGVLPTLISVLERIIRKVIETILREENSLIYVAKHNTTGFFLPLVHDEAKDFGRELLWRVENISERLRRIYKLDAQIYQDIYTRIVPLITVLGNTFEIIRTIISPREYIMVWQQTQVAPLYAEPPWVIEIDGGGGNGGGWICDYIGEYLCKDIFSGDLLGVEVIVDNYYKRNYPDWLGSLVIQFSFAVMPFNETYLPYDVNAHIIPVRILSNWTCNINNATLGSQEYLMKLATDLATNVNISNHSYVFNGILAISGVPLNGLHGFIGARFLASEIIPNAAPKTLAIIIDLEGYSFGLGMLNCRVIAHEFSHAGEAIDLDEHEYICIMAGSHVLRFGEWCLESWLTIYRHHKQSVGGST